ncbi:MAG: 30S ribosomal protein S6 [Candidatus Omnitrophica bacterium]|nr:30S ribosomal protein S6 [Candidatus Omnitrophota bacterium]
MNKYEVMLITKPDLSEEDKKTLLDHINDAITKNNGKVLQASIWAEKRKLYFPIEKCHEGMYYLVNFSAAPAAIKEINHTYKLNEDILRVLFTKTE